VTAVLSTKVRDDIITEGWPTLDQAVNVIAFGTLKPSEPKLSLTGDRRAVYPRTLMRLDRSELEMRVVESEEEEKSLGPSWYASAPGPSVAAYEHEVAEWTAARRTAAERLFAWARAERINLRVNGKPAHASEFAKGLQRALGAVDNTIDHDWNQLKDNDPVIQKLLRHVLEHIGDPLPHGREPLKSDVTVDGRRLVQLIDERTSSEISNPAADGILSAASNNRRRRRYDWDSIEGEAERQLDERGDFNPAVDPTWNQAALEKVMTNWCENRWDTSPVESVIRSHLKEVRARWLAKRMGA
jgi:hypothetical protein